MNVSEEAGKTPSLGELSAIGVEKKVFQDLLNTVVFYKTLIEKYFCLVRQSPKFEPINKQSNKLIRRTWFLLSVSLDKIKLHVKLYQKTPMIYLSIKQIL